VADGHLLVRDAPVKDQQAPPSQPEKASLPTRGDDDPPVRFAFPLIVDRGPRPKPLRQTALDWAYSCHSNIYTAQLVFVAALLPRME